MAFLLVTITFMISEINILFQISKMAFLLVTITFMISYQKLALSLVQIELLISNMIIVTINNSIVDIKNRHFN